MRSERTTTTAEAGKCKGGGCCRRVVVLPSKWTHELDQWPAAATVNQQLSLSKLAASFMFALSFSLSLCVSFMRELTQC